MRKIADAESIRIFIAAPKDKRLKGAMRILRHFAQCTDRLVSRSTCGRSHGIERPPRSSTFTAKGRGSKNSAASTVHGEGRQNS